MNILSKLKRGMRKIYNRIKWVNDFCFPTRLDYLNIDDLDEWHEHIRFTEKALKKESRYPQQWYIRA